MGEVRPVRGTAPLPAAGSVLVLNQPIEIPADRTRLFFQRGKTVGGSGSIDHYHPNCEIEVRELKPLPQRLEPDRFTVTSLNSGQESVVTWDGLQVAGLRFGGGVWPRGSRSIYRLIRFPLHSEKQPQVMRLTCRGALDDYVMARFPTATEIRVALGEILTFSDAP